MMRPCTARELGISSWPLTALLVTAILQLPVEAGAQLNGGVDASKGHATYSIPIVIPPGTAGTGPDLSLVYRSLEGKGPAGWVGFGWNLRGASAITRDLKHGVPYDYDAPRCDVTEIAHADPNWTQPVFADIPCYRDDFVLDQQDLLCAESPCTDLYKTQGDNGRQIRFLGPGLGWEVASRDGSVSTYGVRPETQILNPKNGQVFSWLLDRVEDVHGNWIQYDYLQPPGMGVAYLSLISYAQAGEALANRKVVFVLDDPVLDPRPDRAIGYRAGFRQEVDRRLSTIDVLADGDVLVTSYELSYASAPDSGRSLLASVRRLGSDGSPALPPHVFEYSESAHAFDLFNTSHRPSEGPSLATFTSDVPSCSLPPDRTFLDFNRDGLLDAYEMSTGPQTSVRFGDGKAFDASPTLLADSCRAVADGFTELGDPVRIQIHEGVLDFNADGYPDSYDKWNQVEIGEPSLLLGESNGFIQPAMGVDFGPFIPQRVTSDPLLQVSFPLGLIDESNWNGFHTQNMSLVDMTGDGLPDRVFSKKEISTQQWVGSQEVDFLPWYVIRNLGFATPDAQGDMVWRFAQTPMLWNSPLGGAFEETPHRGCCGATVHYSHLTRDVNGDGLPDQLWAEPGSERIWVAYSYGAGFDPPEVAVEGGTSSSDPNSVTTLRHLSSAGLTADLLDLNGDGFLDQVTAYSFYTALNFSLDIWDSKWLVRFGTGSGFRSSVTSWDVPPFGSPESTLMQFDVLSVTNGIHTVGLADFNGDGLLDNFGDFTTWVYHQSGPLPDLLRRATSPLGGSIKFSYLSSAQMEDEAGNPANPGLGRTRPVVVKTEVMDGRPATPAIVSEYHYANGVFDFAEREFRGYGTVTRLDLDSSDPPGTETVSTYFTDRACTGRLATREIVSGAELVQARESRDYLVVSGPADPGLELSQTWAACLLETTLEEAVEGDEITRRGQKTARDYGPDPVASSFNVQQRTEWGEVDPNDPSIDLGSDGRITHFVYAQPTNPASSIVSHVSERFVTSLDGTLKLTHDRFYFDGLDLGQVGAGVLTKTERWYEDPLAVPPVVNTWVATLVESDAFGNLTGVTGPPTGSDPNGFQSRTTFDPVYQTFPVAQTAGSDLSFGGLTTTTDLTGCYLGLDPPPGLGLPCVITRPGGLDITQFSYDALGRVVSVNEPSRGFVEDRFYELPLPGGVAETTITTQLSIGETLIFTQILDGLGRTVQRDSPGKTSTAEVVRVVRTYDERGRLLSQTIPHFTSTPDPLVRTFGYDPLGRTREILDFDDETRKTFSYAPWQVIEETYFGTAIPANRQERVERTFDGLDRLVQVSNFEDATNPTLPFTITAFYDQMDRLLQVHDAIANDSGLCTQYAMGSACASQQHVTSLAYDTLGRRVLISDPDTGAWRFQFDAAGLLEARTDSRGWKKLFSYDGLQRVSFAGFYSTDAMFNPDATFSYQDDPALADFGRLTSIDSLGMSASYQYEYDAAGRVTALTQAEFGLSFRNEFSYDPLDRLGTRTFPDGEVYTYQYDGLRHVGIDGPIGVLLGAEYDALGRPTELQVGTLDPVAGSPVATLSQSYDPDTARLQAMSGVATGAAGPAALSLDLNFDGLGRLVWQDGAYGASPLGLRSFAYDGLGRLAHAEGPWEQPQGNPGSVSWDFEYDPLGNPRQQTSSSGSGGYERSWAYDNWFSPRALTGFVDADETQTVFRDSNGNTDEVDGALVHFRNWNAQQRMRSETIFDGVSLSSTYFLYDIFGDRVLRITSGGVFIHSVGGDFEYDESGSLATKFFFVGGQRVATRATLYTPTPAWQDHWAWHWIGEPAIFIAAPLGVGLVLLGLFGLGAFVLSRRPPVWVTAPGVGLLSAGLILLPGSLRAATEAGGGPMPEGQHAEPLLIYLSDHLGSTRVVLDANGIPVETRDYAPFGREISHTGAFALRNQFTGQPKLSGTELQDYGARLYDSRWGRFISPDALVESFDSQGMNRYTYVQNQPTSRVDPEGTQSFSFSFSFDIVLGDISVFDSLTRQFFVRDDEREGTSLRRLLWGLLEDLFREGLERLLGGDRVRGERGQVLGSGVPSGPDVVTGPGAGRPPSQGSGSVLLGPGQGAIALAGVLENNEFLLTNLDPATSAEIAIEQVDAIAIVSGTTVTEFEVVTELGVLDLAPGQKAFVSITPQAPSLVRPAPSSRILPAIRRVPARVTRIRFRNITGIPSAKGVRITNITGSI